MIPWIIDFSWFFQYPMNHIPQFTHDASAAAATSVLDAGTPRSWAIKQHGTWLMSSYVHRCSKKDKRKENKRKQWKKDRWRYELIDLLIRFGWSFHWLMHLLSTLASSFISYLPLSLCLCVFWSYRSCHVLWPSYPLTLRLPSLRRGTWNAVKKKTKPPKVDLKEEPLRSRCTWLQV